MSSWSRRRRWQEQGRKGCKGSGAIFKPLSAPSHHRQTLPRAGSGQQLPRPLLVKNKNPLTWHSCWPQTTCSHKSSRGHRVSAGPWCLTKQSASCHSPQHRANMHHSNSVTECVGSGALLWRQLGGPIRGDRVTHHRPASADGPGTNGHETLGQ